MWKLKGEDFEHKARSARFSAPSLASSLLFQDLKLRFASLGLKQHSAESHNIIRGVFSLKHLVLCPALRLLATRIWGLFPYNMAFYTYPGELLFGIC